MLGPQIEQLDLLGGHARLVGEALDDGARRHEVRIGARGKRDRVAAHLARRSDPIRHEHEGSLAHCSRQWLVFQSRNDGGRRRIDSSAATLFGTMVGEANGLSHTVSMQKIPGCLLRLSYPLRRENKE